MKKCMAYRALACHGRLGFSGNRWVPCGLAAADGSRFCKKHGEAVIGGVLGFWVAGLPAEAGQPAPAGRLEPDPACRVPAQAGTGRAAKHAKIRGDASQKKQRSGQCKLPPSGSEA
jgi:hypothetical protein